MNFWGFISNKFAQFALAVIGLMLLFKFYFHMDLDLWVLLVFSTVLWWKRHQTVIQAIRGSIVTTGIVYLIHYFFF